MFEEGEGSYSSVERGEPEGGKGEVGGTHLLGCWNLFLWEKRLLPLAWQEVFL